MSDCIFCKIIKREIKSTIVYEDDETFAFRDINPQSPVHILVIPKKHIAYLTELDEENSDILSKIFLTINKITAMEKVAKTGFRVVANCGSDAQQTVFHIHFHVLGGRPMSWPPG